MAGAARAIEDGIATSRRAVSRARTGAAVLATRSERTLGPWRTSRPHAPAVPSCASKSAASFAPQLSTPAVVESSLSAICIGGCAMRVRVLLQITTDDGTAGAAMEVAIFEKDTERPEDLGLSIPEGKALMVAVQRQVVDAQVASWVERDRYCEACGTRRRSKGSYPITFMTLYGDVYLRSPRLHRCPCQGTEGPATASPLRNLISNHVAPERLYLEARWASLAPYAAVAGLLADVLPIASGANAKTLHEHTLRVAERAEANWRRNGPASLMAVRLTWRSCLYRRGASSLASTAAISVTGVTTRKCSKCTTSGTLRELTPPVEIAAAAAVGAYRSAIGRRCSKRSLRSARCAPSRAARHAATDPR